MAKDKKTPDKVTIASNRKARFNYEILEVFEAGIALKGPEVKSLRAGQLTLEGSFALVDGEELFLHNMYIAPYANNTVEEIPPTRTRKLLMRGREISRLGSRQNLKGLTLVPLEIYFKRGWAKVALALAKGKRGPDKRQSLRKKQTAREMERSFKGKYKV